MNNTPQPGNCPIAHQIADTKGLRQKVDGLISELTQMSSPQFNPEAPGGKVWPFGTRSSRSRSVALTKLEEAKMWLGKDLGEINEELPGSAPYPYPTSCDPKDPTIHPEADKA